jgi:hypothetical protein
MASVLDDNLSKVTSIQWGFDFVLCKGAYWREGAELIRFQHRYCATTGAYALFFALSNPFCIFK